MKRIVSLVCAMALFIGLFGMGHVNVFATESTQETDYSALFTESQYVDALSIETYAERLIYEYTTNSQNFLNNLSAQEDDIILSVIGLWTTSFTADELTSLHNEISTLAETEYNEILEILVQHISCREYGMALESYTNSINSDDYSFDAATIKRFIDLNIEIGSEDEELNQTLALAYECSPNLFATTISSYSDDEIANIAENVAAGYILQNKTMPVVTSSSTVSTENRNIINLIQAEIASAYNPKIEAEDTVLITPDVELMSLCVPTIGTMTYSSAPLVVGNAETLKITFSENTQISSLRQWWVEVYQVVGSKSYLKSSQTITMTPGTTTSTYSFPLSFSDTCNFYTKVKVYSYQGASLLTERTGTYPDEVNGYWRVNVKLPVDRMQTGTLYLYNASGILQKSIECLGRSVSNADPSVYKGNTPMGTYTGYLHGPVSPSSSYGPYKVIATNNVSGLVVEAGRSGIWIHGGHDTQLNPTYGCVRITNPNQLILQNNITNLINSAYHYPTGNVYITQNAS